MNQDNFNMEIRKYLKKVGITSQIEITELVNQAISEGKLTGNETLKAKTKITLQDLGYELEIDGEISLD
jgi:predicted Co/Zn/Cd cation transporter (cation efflux family)